jgi:hypothetical protein
MERLPFRANLAEYGRQADAVLNGWKVGDERAIRFFWEQHPRFRRLDVLSSPAGMTSETERRCGTGWRRCATIRMSSRPAPIA